MCERGGLSFLQMSEWKYQICVMLDIENATQFSYFQCQKFIEFENVSSSLIEWFLRSKVHIHAHRHRCWMVTLSVFSSKRRHSPGVINNRLRLWLWVQWVSGQFMSFQCPDNKSYALLSHICWFGVLLSWKISYFEISWAMHHHMEGVGYFSSLFYCRV